MTHNFLVELGTEELPPTSLKELSEAFSDGVRSRLQALNLPFSTMKSFATPRRLAILIEGLAPTTPVEEKQIWGPPAAIAFDAKGKPTKAAEAFAAKNGITTAQLGSANDGKQDKLVCTISSGGEKTTTLLGNLVRESLQQLPIKKRMRWGASRVEFVRPVQWLVMLCDNQVLNETVLGMQAGRKTRGHRFHANHWIEINDVLGYEAQLETEGKIIASFAKRREIIETQVKHAAQAVAGDAVISEDLLDEVTALVELPVALGGKFDPAFLQVPAEALVSSMKEHQKYFHVVDKDGNLMPNFITVANINSRDAAKVIEGNERVIRPRLADAVFFFETDKKSSLASRREKLKSLLFQDKLGSVYDKTQRIERLGEFIAQQLAIDSTQVKRAAQLCKSDLVSAMVYEFPDMQGVAGFHYATCEGEDTEVALALREQYQPKFSGDAVPSSLTGAIIALSDRIDTVTGIFGIGQKPSGSKDPFALRRASLGILRILVEKKLPCDLRALMTYAAEGFDSLSNPDVVEDVLSYCIERFRAWYQEENIPAEVFQAVQAKQLTTPLDIHQRVYAVKEFLQLKEALSLAEANKRVSNILAKVEGDIPAQVNEALLEADAEKVLARELAQAFVKVAPLLAENRYSEALSSLACLKPAVDAFFDNVMVMTEDLAVRNNRLALLATLRSLFLEVADISYLVVKA